MWASSSAILVAFSRRPSTETTCFASALLGQVLDEKCGMATLESFQSHKKNNIVFEFLGFSFQGNRGSYFFHYFSELLQKC